MKAHPQHHPYRRGANDNWKDLGHFFDRYISPLATATLALGTLASIIGTQDASNYILAAGVLLHLAAWFAEWWEYDRSAFAERY